MRIIYDFSDSANSRKGTTAWLIFLNEWLLQDVSKLTALISTGYTAEINFRVQNSCEVKGPENRFTLYKE